MVAGLDLGTNGAIAVLDTESGDLAVHDYPTFKIKIGKTLRTRIDLDATCSLIAALVVGGIDLAVLEEPGRRGQQSSGAALTFGHSAGVVEAFIVAAHIPRRYVTPSEWKKSAGLPARGKRSERKDIARQAATRLFPQYQSTFARVKDDGRAEAALLANYAKQLIGVTA